MRSNSITERINEVMRTNHIQKKVLAAAIGVPATTLNTWLNRGGDFPVSYLYPIAQAIGVHPLWIVTGEEFMMPEIPEGYVELSEEEAYMIDTLRALDREGRVVVANKAVEELRRLKTSQGSAASTAG